LIGEELLFDYGKDFKNDWIDDFNKKCLEYKTKMKKQVKN
jgi:hypothetical protein